MHGYYICQRWHSTFCVHGTVQNQLHRPPDVITLWSPKRVLQTRTDASDGGCPTKTYCARCTAGTNSRHYSSWMTTIQRHFTTQIKCNQLAENIWCIYASANHAIIGLDNVLSPIQCKTIVKPRVPYCEFNTIKQISLKFESRWYNSHSGKCV